MPKRILLHPVLKNVEYASIKRKGKAVLEIPGSDLVNIAWRDFQIYVGKKIGIGKFAFTIKFKNSGELYTGMTNAVDLDLSVSKSDDNEALETVLNAFKGFKAELANATQSGGVTVEMLLSSTKQGYDTQLDFLRQQVTDKVVIITELKVEVKDLNLQLDKSDIIIQQLEVKTGYTQYFDPISKMLIAKFGAGKPVKLGESDPSGIPMEVLEVLGIVDYTEILPEDLDKIVQLLKRYITATNLPLKGQ